ncbi:hypothetical protein B7463_g12414, partial [Scytalidium lignicola]
MSDTDSYVYSPLKNASTQFRLLRIVFDVKVAVGHKVNIEPISGSLLPYYLSSSTLPRAERLKRSARLPPFTALSYVWGDTTRSQHIFIDGKKHGITESLYRAIRDLQRVSVGNFYLWADAICINQDDSAERSAQILLMRDIYHTASNVEIWLGPSTDDGLRCIKFIEKLTNPFYDDQVRDEGDEEKEERALGAFLKSAAVILNSGIAVTQFIDQAQDIIKSGGRDNQVTMSLELDDDEKTIAKLTKWSPSDRRLKLVSNEDFGEIARWIDTLLVQDCPWFERMWVVQELATASSAEILYGGREVEWNEFLKVLYYLHYKCKTPLPNIVKLTMLEKIRVGWNKKKRLPLQSLIRECQYRRATDPRDRIYALFGLMGDRMNDLLQPDYNKDVKEVYALTTIHFIQQTESLDPICGWQTQGREDLPSWIPDYSLDQSIAASPLVPKGWRPSFFAASGYEERKKYKVEDPMAKNLSSLDTIGLIIDSITTLSDNVPKDESFNFIELVWSSTLATAGDILQQTPQDLTASLEVISSIVNTYFEYWDRLNLADSYSDQDLLKIGSLSDYIAQNTRLRIETVGVDVHRTHVLNKYLHSLLCGRITATKRLSDRDIDTILSLKFPENASDESQNNVVGLICKAFENGMRERNLSITSKGYIGAVPQEAQKGDLICILFGCSVPVVLRSGDNDTYKLIGECYLHGFMDGEGIVMDEKGQLKEQHFILN